MPELLRRAVGWRFRVRAARRVALGEPRAVANSYGKGRAFIAGDAAHQNTPSGGFGMNTGIGDAVDLAWKLWGTLAGWGGPALLESYEAERRPVAKRNTQEATRNLLRFRDLSPGRRSTQKRGRRRQRAAFKQRAVRCRHPAPSRHRRHRAGLSLRSSPIICADGTEPPADTVRDYVPTSRPGHRAPHAWLDGGPPPRPAFGWRNGRSTLDLFGDGFALLSFRRGGRRHGRSGARGATRAMPLTVFAIAEPEIARTLWAAAGAGAARRPRRLARRPPPARSRPPSSIACAARRKSNHYKKFSKNCWPPRAWRERPWQPRLL